MEPYAPRRNQPGYILWFFVIALAVWVATLAASFIQSYLARERLNLYIQGLNRSMARQFAETERRSKVHEEELRNKRMHSPQGRQLAANCHDWQQELKRLNSPTVREGVKIHCDAYEKYLLTGR